MSKEEEIKQYKSLFPDNVETIVLTKEDYDRQLGQLQFENIILRDRIDKATQELFELINMIYKPETREENIPIQRKISNIIIGLNGKGSEDNDK